MAPTRKETHIKMGREAAGRCMEINGLREHCEYYCPLNLRGDAQGKKNAAEFKEGWESKWEEKS